MQELVTDIAEIIRARNELARRAEEQYSREVENIIRTRNKDKNQIERLLDYILDFCFDPNILVLFKKLCRYYYKIDPEATVSYVNSYREMWDEVEEKP